MKVVFAHYTSIPFITAALGVLYYAWTHDGVGAVWMVPFLVIAALIWVLAPQINWRWYSKHPPELGEGVIKALQRFCGFYQNLDASGQETFRHRLALTRMSTEWLTKNMPDENVPPDIQTAIAAQSVIITWRQSEFLFPQYEKVIVSPDAFLSPEFPYRHHSESYAPENCILLSAKAVMDGFAQPDIQFNVALYEYAKIFLLKKTLVPAPPEVEWEDLERISGWSRQVVETSIGIAGIDALPVALCLYHLFPVAFRRELLDMAEVFDTM
jgi:hypothetical protein